MRSINRTVAILLLLVSSVAAAGGVVGWRALGRSGPDAMDWASLPLLGEVERTSTIDIDSVVGTTYAAIRSSVAECAAAEAVPADTDPDPALEHVQTRSIQLRAPSIEEAQVRGLHLVSTVRESRALDAETEPTAPSPPLSEEELAVHHDVLDRCTREAVEPLTEAGAVVGPLKAGYLEAVLGDEAIAAAIEEWQGCMAEAGYPILGMGEASTVLRDELEAVYENIGPAADGESEGFVTAVAVLEAAERELALAQVGCDDAAYGPQLDHWMDLDRQWIRDNKSALRDLDPQVRLQWRFIVGL